jgi:hypothetical protein
MTVDPNSLGVECMVHRSILVLVAALALAAAGCNGESALSEDSTCAQYKQADPASQDRFAQDVINKYSLNRGVGDLEGYLSYNCGENIDRKLSSLLAPLQPK